MEAVGRKRGIGLRPATERDAEFVYRVRVSGMKGHVTRLWGWDEEEQRARFAERRATSTFEIVTVDGVDIGVLSVDLQPAELFLGYLGILPEHQRRGLGTAVLGMLLAEAAVIATPVALRVLKVNDGARRLYKRLGFESVGETETHDVMRSTGATGSASGPIDQPSGPGEA